MKRWLSCVRATVRAFAKSGSSNSRKTILLDGFVDEVLENVEEMTYPQGAIEAEIDDMLNGLQVNKFSRSVSSGIIISKCAMRQMKASAKSLKMMHRFALRASLGFPTFDRE